MRRNVQISAKEKKNSLKDFILVGCLIWLAFALRLYNLGGPSLWYDELLQLDIAQGPLTQIGPKLERHAAMPLDYYLLHGWIELGRQETWVRFPALIFGTLAVPLIYVLATRMFNRTVGYLAAILLTWSSFAILYSQEARPYALLTFLVLLGYWGLWQVYRTNRARYWIVAIFGIAGAMLTHYFALFMLLPMGLFVAGQQLFHLKQKRIWLQSGYFALCLLIVMAVFTFNGRLRHLYNVGTRFATVTTQPETLSMPASEKPNKGSGPPREPSFFVGKVLTPLSTVNPETMLLYNGCLLVAILSLLRSRPKNRLAVLLLLAWLCLPIILIYLFLLQRGTFYAVRYILYTLPAYLILVAYGLQILAGRLLALVHLISEQRRPRWRYALLSGVLLFALVPLILAQIEEIQHYHSTTSREDWRAVGQLLADNAQPNDAVIAVKAEPALNWYYPPARAPYGALSSSQAIWQAMDQHPRRWFVLSSYSFKRDEGLRNWLSEQQAVTIAIDRRVVVHFHQEGSSREEMLAQVQEFSLPQKAMTYAVLAEQFKASGDLKTSQVFYRKAVELARTPSQKANYQARLAALASS